MKRILLPLFVALCVARAAHAQPAGSAASVPAPTVMPAQPGAASDTTKPSPIGSESAKSPGAAPQAAAPAGPAWYDELAARPKDISTNFWLPKAVNKEADDSDMMFYAILAMNIFFFIAITVAVVYLVWKYRGRPGHKPEPSPAHNDALEITWTVIPTIIVVFLFYFGWRAYMKVVTPPTKAVEVNVLAKRWKWDFTYENGVSDPNLHVPVRTPVRLVMTSVDVLHSFYIPVMRVKQDLVPRRYTYAWFYAETPGTYQMYCAEYCGTDHSQMKPSVVVHEEGQRIQFTDAQGKHHDLIDKGFRVYLDDKAAEVLTMNPVDLGKKLYESKGCNSCHTTDGTPRVGPTWASKDWGKQIAMSDGQTVTMDENYVRESILSPQAKARPGYPPSMPPFEGLKEKELAGLIAYIKSLKQ
jgi:cytochrome c oxidase subunit 2